MLQSVSFFKRFTFNYLYISLIILWGVIQLFIGIDGKGLLPCGVTIVYLFSNARNWRRLFSSPYIYWFLWVIYALVNTFFIQGSPMKPELRINFVTSVVAGPLIMVAIAEEYSKDKSYCLKFLGYILIIYTACALLFPNDDIYGHGISALGNILPITIVFLAFVYSMRFISKYISFKLLMVILSVSMFIIVISATRKAFGGVIIVLFFTYLAYFRRLSFSSIFWSVIALLSIYVLMDVLETSDLFSRFSEAEERTNDMDYADNWFLKLMDDRAIMYVEGWLLFLDNMWLGIGLKNFVNKGYSYFTLHTEYMVQLTECGIIGSLLFLQFYLNIIKNLIKPVLKRQSMALMCFGGLLVILFMSLTAWTYNQPIFFVGLGLIIAYIKCDKNYKNI